MISAPNIQSQGCWTLDAWPVADIAEYATTTVDFLVRLENVQQVSKGILISKPTSHKNLTTTVISSVYPAWNQRRQHTKTKSWEWEPVKIDVPIAHKPRLKQREQVEEQIQYLWYYVCVYIHISASHNSLQLIQKKTRLLLPHFAQALRMPCLLWKDLRWVSSLLKGLPRHIHLDSCEFCDQHYADQSQWISIRSR